MRWANQSHISFIEGEKLAIGCAKDGKKVTAFVHTHTHMGWG